MPVAPTLPIAAMRLPAEVSAEQYRVKNTFVSLDEKTATRRAAERARGNSFSCFTVREDSPCSQVSTADSCTPRVTETGSKVPSFLVGCESPQSMRCAMFARPQAWQPPPQQQQQLPFVLALPQFVLPQFAPAWQPPPPPTPAPLLETSRSTTVVGSEAKKKKRPLPPARDREQTLLVRNLPRELEPAAVLGKLSGYRHFIDFLYVPIDFESNKNLGYAFVNFCDKAAVPALEDCLAALFGADTFLQPAKIAGRDANVKRFRNSSVMAVLPEDCKPMLFDRGVQVPFPAPTRKLPPVGPRFRTAAG